MLVVVTDVIWNIRGGPGATGGEFFHPYWKNWCGQITPENGIHNKGKDEQICNKLVHMHISHHKPTDSDISYESKPTLVSWVVNLFLCNYLSLSVIGCNSHVPHTLLYIISCMWQMAISKIFTLLVLISMWCSQHNKSLSVSVWVQICILCLSILYSCSRSIYMHRVRNNWWTIAERVVVWKFKSWT